jgi:heat shock protein HslJ
MALVTTSTVPVPGLACLLPLLWVLGCAPDEQPPGLDGRVFLAETVSADPPPPLVGDTRMRLSFHAGMELEARAGCNMWGGSYVIEEGEEDEDADTLVVTDTSQGTVGCEPELHAQDDWYFAFLESGPSFEHSDDVLVLERDATRIQYRDEEVATPNLELIGPTWRVDAISRGAVVVRSEWAMPATLEFGESGTVVIDTGCNTGSAHYQSRITTLSFSTVAVTDGACEGDPAILDGNPASLEATVLDLLDSGSAVTWRLTGNRLWLEGSSLGLELVAGG